MNNTSWFCNDQVSPSLVFFSLYTAFYFVQVVFFFDMCPCVFVIVERAAPVYSDRVHSLYADCADMDQDFAEQGLCARVGDRLQHPNRKVF
ncbi:hypothetical protein [Alphabaculovirus myunipunctae]|uniref:Uncharacterized protein n=1 Tax=Mythimna unipuncta nucleopolyhedrovirus TaxID=447897 RepID=A0A2K9VS30_9ABAC|nr:hypothetical protein [Mythimna unipuncta nucleopolyhedrovirus]AUV65264.1 hypothetical protein [Mythimna unipuncta nucleopolyhedrovirus]